MKATMRPHEVLLPMSMALLAVLGTLLLGMGQSEFSRFPLILIVAVTTVIVTDIKQWFCFNRTLASIGALVAAGQAFSEIQLTSSSQLVAIANLLVYLQIVLLFQEKTNRIYWQLLMMSLLQVVVAAVLNLSVLFGFMLVIYLFTAVTALSLFYIFRETQRYRQSLATNRTALFRAEAVPKEESGRSEKNAGRQFFDFNASRSTEMIADWGIFSSTCKTVCVTLVVTVLVFFIVPRFGGSPWRGERTGPANVVGFSQKVRLGSLGYVRNNRDVVMRIKLVDHATNVPFQVVSDLLLRGTVVTDYLSATAEWRQSRALPENNDYLPKPTSQVGLVRQELTLEPLNEPVVFCVVPPTDIGSRADIRYDASRQQLIRPEENKHDPEKITIGTTGIYNSMQFSVIPISSEAVLKDEELEMLVRVSGDSLDDTNGPDRLAGLKELAVNVLRKANVDPTDRVRAARTLESFFRRKGEFKYSLQSSQYRLHEIDAIEDFVTNHRQGNCEFFASALALMLRSQKIPARVVIGFKAMEWNSFGQFYQVRQQHAHTWVEAFLEPEHVKRMNIHSAFKAENGGWLQLDPTPGSETPTMTTFTGLLANIGELASYAELLWTNYVVGLDHQRQQQSIYAPLAKTAVETAQGIVDAKTWRERLTRATQKARSAMWSWLEGNWFSWRGGLAAVVLCLFAVGVYHIGCLLWRRLHQWNQRRRQSLARRGAFHVRFYHRLETLLKRHGVERTPGQTQYELATSVGGHLAESPCSQSAAPLPRRVVEAYYRVRFGGQKLSKREIDNLERIIVELEAALRRREGTSENWYRWLPRRRKKHSV